MAEESAESTADIATEAIKVLSPELPRRRARRVEESADAVEAAPAATTKFLVIGGAIAPFGGGRADLIHPGSVVDLTAEQAKHYNKLGYLKPYLEE